MVNIIVEKYIYFVACALILLAGIEICEAIRNKRWIKFSLLIMVIGATLVNPVFNLITVTPVVKEEFMTDKENIQYSKGDTGNIIIKTGKYIEEPIDLRVKDTWTHLTYLTDYYIVKDNREIMISYEFGNNDKTNKEVAKQGLVFTYKTRQNR